MKGGFLRLVPAVALLVVWLAMPQAALAHSPEIDACTCDWCYFFVASPTADTASNLTCNLSSNISPNPTPACQCGPPSGVMGEETAWFDAAGDNKVINDVAAVATTSDANMLYFAAALFNDPDPNQSIPNAQVAIDVVPGGNTQWRDLNNKLLVKDVGQNANIDPDYLLVFDFSDFPFGAGFVNQYMRAYEATTTPGTWTLLGSATVAVDPGVVGGTGGPPGKIEVGIPWSLFSACTACPDFGPETPFRWTLIMPQGAASPIRSFTPTGPIEDLISEVSAGTYTTTPNSCASGAGSTDCELADGSSDGFIGVGTAAAPAGEAADTTGGADPLRVNPGAAAGTLDLSWGASCLATDTDYEIYSGTLGSFATSAPVACSTGGMTSATIDAAAGNVFYLVVPTNGSSEGSYGRTSAGAERPASATQCKPQLFEGC